jgi:hypothetical protein
MKTTSRSIATALGIAVVATLFVSRANAQCGVSLGSPDSQSLQQLAQPRLALQATPSADSLNPGNPFGASIVGMWEVTFVSENNTAHTPPIPDGAVIDFGYSQWHIDGTEFLNSGGRAPATQNYCLGVWQPTGLATYQLNHFALSYDAGSGALNGKVNIRENVTLDRGGNTYAGTFTIDVYDPTGTTHLDHIGGRVTGTRVTVNTTLP